MSPLLLPLSVRGGKDSAEIAHNNMEQPILITNFTGQAENPHIGSGVNVGVDLYTTKNVARLSRKMEKKSASIVTSLPLYVSEDNSGNVYAQAENGTIYKSVDQGDTWTVLAGNSGGAGYGIAVFQDCIFSCTPTDIDVYNIGTATWYNGWWTNVIYANKNALQSTADSNHYCYVDIAQAGALYITNGRFISSVIVLAGQVFNPTGTPGVNYVATEKAFTLSNNYVAKVLGYMPPNTIAIGAKNRLNDTQADIIMWNGVSDSTAQNVVTLPGASGPVTNILTRNGIIYAVTTNEAGVYTVNGSSGKVVDRLGLRMTNRLASGEQYTTRVQPTIRVGSADFLGPEALIGVCNYPQLFTQVSGTGLYPYGVWAIDVEGSNVYTKYPLSHGDINANYNTDYEMGFLKVLSNGKVLVGWGKSSTFGIDALNPNNYISNASTVFIESELYEVGTVVNPETFSNIYYNLVEPLKTDEEIKFYYRLSQADPYTLFNTDTVATLGTNLGGIITPLPFQQAKYIQIGISIKTGSATPLETPQLVSVYLNK